MSRHTGNFREEVDRKTPQPLIGFFLRLIREKPLGIAGGSVLVIMLFAGIFANLVPIFGSLVAFWTFNKYLSLIHI